MCLLRYLYELQLWIDDEKMLVFICFTVFVSTAYAENWSCSDGNKSRLRNNRDKIHDYYVLASEISETLDWSHRTPLYTLSKKGQASLRENYRKDGAAGLKRLRKEISRIESLKSTAQKASNKLYLTRKHIKKNIKHWESFKSNCHKKRESKSMSIGVEQSHINLEYYEVKAKVVKKILADFRRDLSIYKQFEKAIQ